jgi:molybdopterin-guanine dinucleotide biosynthesis protein A
MTLTAALFVGGMSRRMGADKAALNVAGEPLWTRQLRTIRELQPEVIRISARARPVWCPPDVETLLDEPPSRGPLSGLAALLVRLRTTHLLVLAIDLPRITTAMLGGLWREAKPGCGVIPVSDGRYEPLCAIYPAGARDEATRALAGPDLSLQSLTRTLVRVKLVELHRLRRDELPLFQNVNSPPDLESLAPPARNRDARL